MGQSWSRNQTGFGETWKGGQHGGEHGELKGEWGKDSAGGDYIMWGMEAGGI